MGLYFSWRGDQYEPRYAFQKGYSREATSSANKPVIASKAEALGGSALECILGGDRNQALAFSGVNMPRTKLISVVIGFIPNFTGAPSTGNTLFNTQYGQVWGSFKLDIISAGNGFLVASALTEDDVLILDGSGMFENIGDVLVANQRIDIVFTFNMGTTVNDAVAIGYVNNILGVTRPNLAKMTANDLRNKNASKVLSIGAGPAGGFVNGWFDEVLVFDHILSSEERAFFDGSTSRGYYPAEDLEWAAAPTAGQLKIGEMVQGIEGTYDGSDRWTYPGNSNVKVGVQSKENSLTLNRTGTLESISLGSLTLKGKSADGAGGILRA